jgi:uncharacterized secreted protein with C-terminal beta-propeller domain
MFDVKNASFPLEVDKYFLDDYWSEVSNNHHAFLQDSKNRLFFLPGGKGGYVFSYSANGAMKLVKAVEMSQVRRALYINDYLYVLGDSRMVVYDEKTWERVKELSYGQ